MRQQRDVETVCQVFLFGLHRVALLIFLKTGLGSLMFREGPVQKCVSTERGEEGSDIRPYPRTFVLLAHLPDLCSSALPTERPSPSTLSLPTGRHFSPSLSLAFFPFPTLTFTGHAMYLFGFVRKLVP